MKTNHRSGLRLELKRLYSEPVNRLGGTKHRRRLTTSIPKPGVQEPELETDAPAPTQSEPHNHDSTPSVFTLYLREIGQVKLLSREEEAALARRIQGGDEAAREQMIKANLRLVVKLARDFEGRGLPLLDLISEGNIGLMRAVERYDPDRGARLSTYASYWIVHRILCALRDQVRTIRLPHHVVDQLHTIDSVSGRLHVRLGRDPTNDEIAQEISLPAARIQKIREAAQTTVSLDAPLHDGEEGPIAEVVPEERSTPAEEVFADSDTIHNLHQVLGQLSPREQSVIQFRFGLGSAEEQSLEEIGRKIDLTRERVRQIEDGALQKLRKKLKNQQLLRLAAR